MASKKSVLVALSGGVDSAVAAWQLREAGYDVHAAYLRSWHDETGDGLFADCPWEEDIRLGNAVARHLGISFEVIDVIDAYRERVVDYLVEGYRRGQTPNPDIMCNREMKFGLLREVAEQQGFDALATGHYCRRLTGPDGRAAVGVGRDANKDQSYFLAMVPGEALQRVLFPVGELEKPAVRELARQIGLPNADRKDSQGICFLGKVDINRFLARYIPDRPGEIVHAVDGRVLGEHRGLHHFTLGQRKGIGVPSNTDHERYVVVAKDFASNQLKVAFDRLTAPGLYQWAVETDLPVWQSPRTPGAEVLARVRYRDPPVPVRLASQADGLRLDFEVPQRALAIGQVVALYEGERLLGGATYRAVDEASSDREMATALFNANR